MADRSQHNLAGWLGVGLAFGDTPGFDYRYHLGRLGHCDLSCVAWSVGGGSLASLVRHLPPDFLRSRHLDVQLLRYLDSTLPGKILV